MIDYGKICRMASRLERIVCAGDDGNDGQSFVNKLDKRVEREQKKVDAPEPSLEAGEFDEDTSVECCDDAEKKAHLKKLVRLARRVRNSSMSASEKRLAMSRIADAKKNFRGMAAK